MMGLVCMLCRPDGHVDVVCEKSMRHAYVPPFPIGAVLDDKRQGFG